jgi:hypothetical protein
MKIRILSGTLLVLVPFFLALYLMGARSPLTEPTEDPRLVAMKRDPIAMQMVKWIKQEVEMKTSQWPEATGCWRERSQGTCSLYVYNRRIYVKVWIDSDGAHWRPLKELKV